MANWIAKWEVQGSAKKPYVVSFSDEGGWGCSCVGWTRHIPRKDCKHIKKIKAQVGGRPVNVRPEISSRLNAIK